MLYRLNTPTMGIVNSEGCDLVVIVPAGSVVAVQSPLPVSKTSPAVEVDWSGTKVRMFPVDILQAEEIQLQPLQMAAGA